MQRVELHVVQSPQRLLCQGRHRRGRVGEQPQVAGLPLADLGGGGREQGVQRDERSQRGGPVAPQEPVDAPIPEQFCAGQPALAGQSRQRTRQARLLDASEVGGRHPDADAVHLEQSGHHRDQEQDTTRSRSSSGSGCNRSAGHAIVASQPSTKRSSVGSSVSAVSRSATKDQLSAGSVRSSRSASRRASSGSQVTPRRRAMPITGAGSADQEHGPPARRLGGLRRGGQAADRADRQGSRPRRPPTRCRVAGARRPPTRRPTLGGAVRRGH